MNVSKKNRLRHDASKARKKLILHITSFKNPDYIRLVGEKYFSSVQKRISNKEKILNVHNQMLELQRNYLNNLYDSLEKEKKRIFEWSNEQVKINNEDTIKYYDKRISEQKVKINEKKIEIKKFSTEIEKESEKLNKDQKWFSNFTNQLKQNINKLEFFIDIFQKNADFLKYEISYTAILLTELFQAISGKEDEKILEGLAEDFELKIVNFSTINWVELDNDSFLKLMVTDHVDVNFDFLLFLTIRQTPEHEISDLLDYQLSIQNEQFVDFVKIYLEKHSGVLNEIQKRIVEKWIEAKKHNEPLIGACESYIKWKGDKTEFIQMFTALFENKTMEVPKGKKGEAIVRFAKYLDFELDERWSKNLSNSIHQNNADYIPPIFDNLKNAYEEYRNQRLMAKKNK